MHNLLITVSALVSVMRAPCLSWTGGSEEEHARVLLCTAGNCQAARRAICSRPRRRITEMEMICGSGNRREPKYWSGAALIVLHSPDTLFNAAPRSYQGPNEMAGASRLDVFCFQRRAILRTSLVTGGCLRSCCLPALCKQSQL